MESFRGEQQERQEKERRECGQQAGEEGRRVGVGSGK